jgi:hypothetical protein
MNGCKVRVPSVSTRYAQRAKARFDNFPLVSFLATMDRFCTTRFSCYRAPLGFSHGLDSVGPDGVAGRFGLQSEA